MVKLCRRSNYQGRRKLSGSDRCYYRNSCHPCFPLCTNSLLAGSWKESTIIVNTAECSRQQSHLQKDNKPYGKKAYYGGYLADLQQELSDNSIPSNLVDNPSKIVKDVAGKDINGLKDYFLEKRLNTYKQIDEAPLSSAAKEILKANTDITTAIGLFMGKTLSCVPMLSVRN